jgi:lipoprotein NlpI
MFKAAIKTTDRCLAHFYVGEWHLLRKEFADATADLKAAVELCSRDVTEYRAAVAELARQKPYLRTASWVLPQSPAACGRSLSCSKWPH